MVGWGRAALCGVLLLEAACGRQDEATSNDAAVTAQERTMKEANDDVDAAMVEAGMTNTGAPANSTTVPER